jgi:hypothetical protein
LFVKRKQQIFRVVCSRPLWRSTSGIESSLSLLLVFKRNISRSNSGNVNGRNH